MNRISERISATVSSVKCPGCEKRVLPTFAAPEAPPETGGEESGQPRWSFIWRPPSGEVCPECGFPLQRYARRVKWIRLFSAGIVLLTLGVLLAVLGTISEPSRWVGTVRNGLLGVGLVAFLVGLVGVVLGGRSSSDGGEAG
jgi:hypothetical protein